MLWIVLKTCVDLMRHYQTGPHVLILSYYQVLISKRLRVKQEAVLVNASRGPVVDEVALVEHLKANPMFRVGLDVFEVRSSLPHQLL
jgi:hypothetical protein